MCYSTASYTVKNFKMDSGIKRVEFAHGFIVTENDLFRVSSFSYTVNTNNEVSFYVDCYPEDRNYIKSELLSKQGTMTFIGPMIKDSIIPKHTHYVVGFSDIHNVHFITGQYGIQVIFNHISERRFLYVENREYVHRNCVDFNYYKR